MKKQRISLNTLVNLMFIIMVVASFIGSVIAVKSNFLLSFNDTESSIVLDFIKVNFGIILLWLSGFVNLYGFLFNIVFGLVFLFFKGLNYGFTASLIIKSLGVKGVVYNLILFLPQCVFLIPLYFFAVIAAADYNMKKNLKRYALTGFSMILISFVPISIKTLFLSKILETIT